MKRTLTIFLLAIASTIVCKAEIPEQLQLSIDSCRAMALRNSFDIKIAQETIEKAEAEKNAIFSMYFPKVSGVAGVTYVFKDIELLQSIEPLIPSYDLSITDIPSSLQQPIADALGGIKDQIVSAWQPIDISLKGAF